MVGDIMQEKIIPHSIEAEQAVLGSMFLSKYALQKGVEELNKDLFYLDSHSKIFAVISELAETNRPIDIVSVTAELDKRKELKQIGNVEYLTEIVNSVASAANIDEYIKIVEEKAIRRRLIETSLEIETAGYNSQDSLNELLDNAEKKMLNVVKTRKGTEFRKIQDVLSEAQSNLEKLSQSDGEITGITTGFDELDKVTSGLHPNELIIVAARPAMGKTAWALNLAANIATREGKTVALFNLEMGASQLIQRMIAAEGQITLNTLKTGKLQRNDWKKLDECLSRLSDTKIFIDDTPGMTIAEIRAKCRRLASSEGDLGVIIIDYLQLISGGSRYAGNRQQEIAEISRSLKTLAMELNVPIVALAQLSRTVEGREDKRPILSDLRESGSIEQDADIVSFLYRDDYYNKPGTVTEDDSGGETISMPALDEETSISEFIIAKHRNGPTCTIKLLFKRNTSTFIDIEN